MSKKPYSSIDGFIPRRPGATLGDLHQGEQEQSIDRSLHTGAEEETRDIVGQPREGKAMGRADIDAMLQQIDDEPTEKLSRRQQKKQRRLQKGKKPHSKARRIITWAGILILVILLGVGGYVAWRAIVAGGNVLQGNIFDLAQTQPLKKDENGRSNFVIFGTAEDSEGGMHGGANLTDSIMVASIDQDKKDAYLLSLPRDLWVEYEQQCTVGDFGKLNAAYFCASNDGQDEAAGAEALQRKIGEITGLDIQYYIHLNFTAVTEAVDAVGGVTVTIESSDPRGILDRNFDWRCNYTCFYVNYQNGEVVTLDGERALALARARNAAGGYGLPGGNFDREKNQQKIIRALLDKATSAGTLSNVGAVTGLIDALGNNLRTNINTNEVRTMMDVGSKIDPAGIVSLSLVNEELPLVTTDMISGQSIVRPIAGVFNYDEIKTYVDREVNANPITREAPQVSVLNGGRAAGVAGTEADRLEDEGYTITMVDNASDGTYLPVEIYQVSTRELPASSLKLAQLYNVAIRTETPPFSVVGDADFVIVLGPAE